MKEIITTLEGGYEDEMRYCARSRCSVNLVVVCHRYCPGYWQEKEKPEQKQLVVPFLCFLITEPVSDLRVRPYVMGL